MNNKSSGAYLQEGCREDNYYAFGKRRSVSPVSVDNKYLYNGKDIQDGLEQYDYGARFYDPETARWNVADPLAENSMEGSPYVYVNDNPLRYTDPDGRSPWDWVLPPGPHARPKWMWNVTGPNDPDLPAGYTYLGKTFQYHHYDYTIQLEDKNQLPAGDKGWEYVWSQPLNKLPYAQSFEALQDAIRGNQRGLDFALVEMEVASVVVSSGIGAGGSAAGAASGESIIGRLASRAWAPVTKWFGRSFGNSAVEGVVAKGGIQFTKSTMQLGQQMHKAYKVGDVVEGVAMKEFRSIPGIRPDFVDFSTRTIYELKPFNPRAMQQGLKQLAKYQSEFQKTYGGIWKTVLDTYK